MDDSITVRIANKGDDEMLFSTGRLDRAKSYSIGDIVDIQAFDENGNQITITGKLVEVFD